MTRFALSLVALSALGCSSDSTSTRGASASGGAASSGAGGETPATGGAVVGGATAGGNAGGGSDGGSAGAQAGGGVGALGGGLSGGAPSAAGSGGVGGAAGAPVGGTVGSGAAPCDLSMTRTLPGNDPIAEGAFCDDLFVCTSDAAGLEAALPVFSCGEASPFGCPAGTSACAYRNPGGPGFLDASELETLCEATARLSGDEEVVCLVYL